MSAPLLPEEPSDLKMVDFLHASVIGAMRDNEQLVVNLPVLYGGGVYHMQVRLTSIFFPDSQGDVTGTVQ